MRVSQENENRQGTTNRQSPPPNGSQKADGVSRTFSRSKRLRSREEFRRVKKYGKRITGGSVIFDILTEKFPCHRLGVTVSKRFGDAHLRNLFKRRSREAFRLSQSQLAPGMSVHISPKQEGVVPTLPQLLEDFGRFCQVC